MFIHRAALVTKEASCPSELAAEARPAQLREPSGPWGGASLAGSALRGADRWAGNRATGSLPQRTAEARVAGVSPAEEPDSLTEKGFSLLLSLGAGLPSPRMASLPTSMQADFQLPGHLWLHSVKFASR